MRAIVYAGLAVAVCAAAPILMTLGRDPGDAWTIRAERPGPMLVDGSEQRTATLVLEREDSGVAVRVFASVPATDCAAGEGTITLHLADGSDSEPFHWHRSLANTAGRAARAVCAAKPAQESIGKGPLL